MTKNEIQGSVRLWATVVLIAVFIIGAASGAALWHVCMKPKRPHHPPMMGHIPTDELNLTDDQQQKVEKIFESYRPQLDAVLNETFPKVRAINEEIEKKVLDLLTDEQKKKFEEIKARRPPNDRGDGPRHGMHDGPPPGMPYGPPPPPPLDESMK
jgi:Spy/CpxP family protein refolding chaperone